MKNARSCSPPIRPRRRNGRKGQTIVETACIFIVFFFLLLGCFDMSQFLYVHQALVERTRWAARSGTAAGYTTDQIRNLLVYGTSTAGTTGYFNLTTTMVTVTESNANSDNWNIQVKVSGYPLIILNPFMSGGLTIPTITVDVPLGFYD